MPSTIDIAACYEFRVLLSFDAYAYMRKYTMHQILLGLLSGMRSLDIYNLKHMHQIDLQTYKVR